jgi:hypothetical protein
MTTQSNTGALTSNSFKNMTTLLNSMSFLWADLDNDFRYSNWTNVSIQATECALYLCVKEFNTRVTSGKVLESSNEVSWARDKDSYQVVNPSRQMNSTSNANLLDDNLDEIERTDLRLLSLGGHLPKGPFNISQAGVGGLIYYIDRALDDRTLWSKSNGSNGKIEWDRVMTSISGVVRLVPQTKHYQFTPEVMEVLWDHRANLPDLFGNLAASLTNHLRSTASGGTFMEGEYGLDQAIFCVRWSYITPVILTQLLAMLFLGLTWWKTQQSSTPLWKSSMVSVLFHGLSANLKRTGIKQVIQGETNKEAKAIVAKLEVIDEDGGWCLSKSTSFTYLPLTSY